MTPVNVAVHLSRMAREHPFRPAIFFPAGHDGDNRRTYTLVNYRQLDGESDRIGRGLLASGLQPGDRTVLMVTPSPAFFALTFGLLKSGIVPIMVDPGMGAAKLKECINEAEPKAFIGIPRAHLARKLMGWGRKTIRVLVTVPGGRFGWGLSLNQVKQNGEDTPFFDWRDGAFSDPFAADDTAAINFTSGSTGIPKGAVYTHGVFSAQVELIRKTYGIEPGEIDVCTFPLFALFAPALGMTAIIPAMDFTRPARVNPERIAEIMSDFGPTNLFGGPALLHRVGRWCWDREIRFPTLRRVICSGAPVQPRILELYTSILRDDAQVFSGYGATEAMPLANIGSHEILRETRHGTHSGNGVCVGTPNTGIDMDIIEIRDDPITTWNDSLRVKNGSIGEIVVRGPVVTQSYFNRDAATRAAKIFDPDTGRYRHRMGDLGWIDDRGRLWFCGRKNHRVETSEGPLYTIPVEGIFNAHPDVRRSALVGMGSPGREQPVLCVELVNGKNTSGNPWNHEGSRVPELPEKPVDSENPEHTGNPTNSKDPRDLFRELLALARQYPQTRGIRRFILHPDFPVDIRHNSKIFREKLRLWVQKNHRKIITFPELRE